MSGNRGSTLSQSNNAPGWSVTFRWWSGPSHKWCCLLFRRRAWHAVLWHNMVLWVFHRRWPRRSRVLLCRLILRSRRRWMLRLSTVAGRRWMSGAWPLVVVVAIVRGVKWHAGVMTTFILVLVLGRIRRQCVIPTVTMSLRVHLVISISSIISLITITIIWSLQRSHKQRIVLVTSDGCKFLGITFCNILRNLLEIPAKN